MKKLALLIPSALALAATLAFSTSAYAEDTVTITGKGECAKCALHQSDKCQNVIETKTDGKKVTYWLAQNDVSKDFHENLCHGPKKITATGTVKEEDGKMILTPTKIEEAK